MNHWLHELDLELDRLDRAGLRRRLTPHHGAGLIVVRDGRELVNLSSNDYLGLSQHPRLRAAAIDAIERLGVGAGASRLAGGSLELHRRVEERFARFKHAQAALLCPTGYQAAHALVTVLAGRGDLILLDKLCHASLIDAARASAATVRVFPHLHSEKLERLLQRRSQITNPQSQIFILTDSVFSMDGDVADLPTLCDLAHRHGAILIVDEAHGTGVLGQTGAGLCEAQGVSDRVDVVLSTASKALGGLGGIVTGPRAVIDTIVNRARSFLYTTAAPPAQAAVIDAALDVLADEPDRRRRLHALCQRLHNFLGESPFFNSPITHHPSPILTPIFPLIVGDPSSALALSDHLAQHGFLAPAIRSPTVAPGRCRVRISLRADLTDEHLARLAAALKAWRHHAA